MEVSALPFWIPFTYYAILMNVHASFSLLLQYSSLPPKISCPNTIPPRSFAPHVVEITRFTNSSPKRRQKFSCSPARSEYYGQNNAGPRSWRVGLWSVNFVMIAEPGAVHRSTRRQRYNQLIVHTGAWAVGSNRSLCLPLVTRAPRITVQKPGVAQSNYKTFLKKPTTSFEWSAYLKGHAGVATGKKKAI